MTQISLIVNSMPRDLTEFAFFLIVGFTAGSIGIIWLDFSSIDLNINKVTFFTGNLFKIIKIKITPSDILIQNISIINVVFS